MSNLKFPSEADLLSCLASCSSKGNQTKYVSRDGKWFFKSNFYYQGRYWRDDLVECIASQLAQQGFKFPNCDVLRQYSVSRFGTYGTLSRSFLKPTEQFISFDRIQRVLGIQVPLYRGLDTFKAILDVYASYFHLDALDFLLTQSLLDFLVGNEDRHMHNFGVIRTRTGYRLHPCYDFGLGMFEHDRVYEDFKFRDKLVRMRFKTFSVNQANLIKSLCSEYSKLGTLVRSLVVKPSEFRFPSVAAETYLRHACILLGVRLCND